MITVDSVCALIAKKIGSKADGMTLDAGTAFDSVGLSSLQIADIVYTVEDDADIELDPSQAANVRTVGDLVALVDATKSLDAAA